MGPFSLLLVARLLDWPLPFVVATSSLARRSSLVSSSPISLSLSRLSQLLQLGLPYCKRSYTFVSPLSGMSLLLMTTLLFSQDPSPGPSGQGALRF